MILGLNSILLEYDSYVVNKIHELHNHEYNTVVINLYFFVGIDTVLDI